jgi:CRISPR/Cas system CMR subunit Cmr4 (Cas7 group RAMP superfamily)
MSHPREYAKFAESFVEADLVGYSVVIGKKPVSTAAAQAVIDRIYKVMEEVRTASNYKDSLRARIIALDEKKQKLLEEIAAFDFDKAALLQEEIDFKRTGRVPEKDRPGGRK